MKLMMFYRCSAIAICLLMFGGCSSSDDDSKDGNGTGKANADGDDSGGPSAGGSMTPLTTAQWKKEREKIFQERSKVETLFIARDGRQLVVPAAYDRAIVDPQTGELVWAAWQCNNPDCPGRKPNGDPHLFPWPDHLLYAKSDGTVGMRQPSTEEDFRKDDAYGVQACPECLKHRNLETESPLRKQQYQDWCRRHVLPSTAKRLKELDAQRQALYKRRPKSKFKGPE